MDEQMPSKEGHLLSEQDSQLIFEQWIIGQKFKRLEAARQPEVHFFGGQPGSGKSTSQDPTSEYLIALDGPNALAVVITDEFRKFHPKYADLLRSDDEHAAFYTDSDSGRWVEKSINYAMGVGSHLIIEGTLRNPDIPLGTAIHCKSLGYKPEMHVMAVHQFNSRNRIFLRYVKQLEMDGHGRYTKPEAHDIAYGNLPESLKRLSDSAQFAAITLYDANNKPLVRVDSTETNGEDTLINTLMMERNDSRLDREQILEDLVRSEAILRSYGRWGVLKDLEQLRSEIQQSY